MDWKLSEPAENVMLTAENEGVWIKGLGFDLGNIQRWPNLKTKTRLGRLLPTLIPQLLEFGIASSSDNAICIPYNDFVKLDSYEIDAFDGIIPWAPFALEIKSSGSLGATNFRYHVRFYSGNQQVHLDRIGCFVHRGNSIYQMDAQTYFLIEAIEKFNSAPIDEKIRPGEALMRFSEIKDLSEEVGADLDHYLLHERVLIPSKVGLDLNVDEEGRITFSPKIDGAQSDSLLRAFLASEDVEEIYSLDHPEGGRIRIVLDESQKEVLRRMRKVRKLGGVDKARFLANPYEVFDGVANSIDIDLNDFGPRVKGIGDFPFISQPFIQYGTTGIFDDLEEVNLHNGRTKFKAGLKCRYIDEHEEDIMFETRDSLLKFFHESKVAWEKGQRTVDFKGKTIIVDEELVRGIEGIVKRITRSKNEIPQEKPKGRYLLIYTNEDEIEYCEKAELDNLSVKEFKLPKALREEISLKDHQKKGLFWLQKNRLLERRGCLLADEMGLGKTLQILMFFAWLIEKGMISPEGVDKESAPWNPILIVAPVMLLESETWLNDMRHFFRADGSIFQPWLVLHGLELKKMRREGATGKETDAERAMLDLERLKQYRLIITNYETVVNYQYSFAMMKTSWSVVVTDEAQEYKTPNTKISHALKSLSPQFRIACTGTPVEIHLMDLWNIFDFLQPGNLLGSASEFSNKYEKRILEDPNNRSKVLETLRGNLLFGKPDAYVLRREKSTTLEGLPAKHEHKEYCDLSSEQREKHLDFVSRARAGGEGNHPLSLIHHLMKLYQHPALVPQYEGFEIDRIDKAFERCPKLEKVMEILHEIRKLREKAIIFTRSLAMQDLLTKAITARFSITVDIINGETSRSGGTRCGNNTRKQIIKHFRETDGFNVIVLSPDVAGIGLTLVEANHVIHYGRWWNPAREAQATDRVYRIGQERDVHIYYPISRDPQGAFKTFDEKLDALIQSRRELATDFLVPMLSEDQNGQELVKEMLGETGVQEQAKSLTQGDVSSLPWDRFESLVALFEQKHGRDVILTPRSGDHGIDVISKDGNELRLIQCKHTSWGSNVDEDAVLETINAFDGYRARWLRSLTNLTLRTILVTNGKFSSKAKRKANTHDIELIDSNKLLELLERKPSTLGEIEQIECRRSGSMREVQTALSRMT